MTPGAAPVAPIETDAVVIGAGPVGLFQVFELGLQELHAEVIDVLPVAGGQCLALYPDKPIYDIPSVARCSGRELVANLLRQIAPFGAGFHLGQLVTEVSRQSGGGFRIATSRGTVVMARTVFVAGGVGAFQARGLKLPGLDAFIGSQVFTDPGDALDCDGCRVVVVGGDEAAVEAAIALADRPAASACPQSITLLHRRDVLQAAPDRLAALNALRESGRIAFEVGQIGAIETDQGRLVAVEVVHGDASRLWLGLDTLLVLLGLSPQLGPIARWGLALQKKQLTVDTATFQTSEPGIFAVGDINSYPGKRKLIVSGFHEATLAAFGAAAYLAPGKRILLEYTTASPRLHALLGVGDPPRAAPDREPH